eukprot:2554713-Pleurochrysis_carterae.AAC.1
MPTTGAVSTSMPTEGACSSRSHCMYSAGVSKTLPATGCQMPRSGITSGSSTGICKKQGGKQERE